MLATRVFNRPLAVEQNTLAAFLSGFGTDVFGDMSISLADTAIIKPEAHDLHNSLYHSGFAQENLYTDESGHVAIIPIEGTLIQSGGWVNGYCGLTSYDAIKAQISEVKNNDQIKGVVFEINSYGGEVAGITAAAKAIYDLGAEKPTIAIVNDAACSAAYWLGSQCQGIISSPVSVVGSIGVISAHTDMSKYLAEQGFKVTMIHAGKHKADGNPYEALSDDVYKRFLAEMEQIRGIFADDVARGRKKSMNKKSALDTEALVYIGQSALDIGLVDDIASPEEAFQSFVEEILKQN